MAEEEAAMRIAFVTGCPRSGTSILGELIGSHPDVEYRHESHHVWRRAGPGESTGTSRTMSGAEPALVRGDRIA